MGLQFFFFFFSSRRRHTRSLRDWSSDVCSSDLGARRCVRRGHALMDAGALVDRHRASRDGSRVARERARSYGARSRDGTPRGAALSPTAVAPPVAVAAPPQAIVPPLPPGAGLAVDTALDECAESGRTIDGEAAVTFRLRCPRWVPPLWREAVELARRVAGESLAPWRVADDVAACDPHALDRRMRAAVHALHRVDWQLGRLLRLILDCRLYVLFGFASWSTYVRERLGISTRTAGLLVAIERKTWAAPALMDAYRSGALSTVRALTIAPVVGDHDRDAWIERASEVTLRCLADE